MAKTKKKGGRVTAPLNRPPARELSFRERLAAALEHWEGDGVEHNCRPPDCPGAHDTTRADDRPCGRPPEWTCACGRRWTRAGHGFIPVTPNG